MNAQAFHSSEALLSSFQGGHGGFGWAECLDFHRLLIHLPLGWCSTRSAQAFANEKPSIPPIQSHHSLSWRQWRLRPRIMPKHSSTTNSFALGWCSTSSAQAFANECPNIPLVRTHRSRLGSRVKRLLPRITPKHPSTTNSFALGWCSTSSAQAFANECPSIPLVRSPFTLDPT